MNVRTSLESDKKVLLKKIVVCRDKNLRTSGIRASVRREEKEKTTTALFNPGRREQREKMGREKIQE